jgi:hypothetical protein
LQTQVAGKYEELSWQDRQQHPTIEATLVSSD